jgi:N-acetyl-gamma-glutamyl-phosphate reductase
MLRVGVIGARGYTGAELVRLLCKHPDVELTYLTSESQQGVSISAIYPSLRGHIDLACEAFDVETACTKADLFFYALPAGEAMKSAGALLAAGKRAIDLGADFRLKDPERYRQWYKGEPAPAELSASAVYGLPEIYRGQVREARLVANPGCYPTSAILGFAPLLAKGRIDPASVIIDAKSGVSGAGGRSTIKPEFSFPHINDNFRAYGLVTHQHTPEIEQEFARLSGVDAPVQFTPHLVPMTRGILMTGYASLACEADTPGLLAEYEAFYADAPFVQVLPEGTLPETKYVVASNQCHIGLRVDPRTRRVIVVSAIDNLMRGAAGQAVQNMNVMCGLPERHGLDLPALYP